MHTPRQPMLIHTRSISLENSAKQSGKHAVPFLKIIPNCNSKSSIWIVSKDKLKIPNWTVLTQTVQIFENIDIDTITSRIVEVNKEMSVFAKYYNEEVKATLQTSENIEIIIKLYKAGKKSNTKGIVVEVQRSVGCSVLFHRYSRLILSAVSGELNFSTIPYVVSPESTLPALPFAMKQQHENSVESLNLTRSLMLKDKFDAQRLGFQSLGHLTNLCNTGLAAALMSSRAVLCGCFEEYNQGIDEKIFDTILSWNLDSNADNDSSFQLEHGSILFNKSLLILANSLDVISTKGNEEDLQAVYQNLTNKNILSRLIEILKYSHLRPHDALLSAKSLSILMKACPDVQNDASMMNMKIVVNQANSFGVLSHSALARECEGILAIL